MAQRQQVHLIPVEWARAERPSHTAGTPGTRCLI
uniref:Uncharacterized protein n=1 Tax=Anguilla anguilla TaxID=7936 RepID=A0A0E9V276_ANGAN